MVYMFLAWCEIWCDNVSSFLSTNTEQKSQFCAECISQLHGCLEVIMVHNLK